MQRKGQYLGATGVRRRFRCLRILNIVPNRRHELAHATAREVFLRVPGCVLLAGSMPGRRCLAHRTRDHRPHRLATGVQPVRAGACAGQRTQPARSAASRRRPDWRGLHDGSERESSPGRVWREHLDVRRSRITFPSWDASGLMMWFVGSAALKFFPSHATCDVFNVGNREAARFVLAYRLTE